MQEQDTPILQSPTGQRMVKKKDARKKIGWSLFGLWLQKKSFCLDFSSQKSKKENLQA